MTGAGATFRRLADASTRRALLATETMFTVVIAFVFSLVFAVTAQAQDDITGDDELDRFFRSRCAKPSKEALRDVRKVWKRASIGERFDRLRAREELVALGCAAAHDLLDELLSDNLSDSRGAALVLGRIGGHGIEDALRKIVAGRADGDVRHATMAPRSSRGGGRRRLDRETTP